MSGKYALIIGNTEYSDSGLAQLPAPSKDVENFARVLQDQDICGFDHVSILLNQISSTVIEAIDEFFDQKKPDDLLVLYFSGHGVKDEFGSLYLAFRNTIRSRLRSTAIKSDYIHEAMEQSRSKRQVVILDSCNSGAFPQGVKAEVGGFMGLTTALQGYGRFVLIANDATQFAWEGDKVIGETQNSLFTHFLVRGLEGDADSDGDGTITVDELYDYVYEQISRVTPGQMPTKSTAKQEGEIILRQITRFEDIKPIPLPDDLISETEDIRPYVREAAVGKLEKILKSKNLRMTRSAIEALEKIVADENTTRRVATSAMQVLESYHQEEQKAEEARLALEKAEVEQKAKETERLSVEETTNEEDIAQAEIASEDRTEEKLTGSENIQSEGKTQEEAEHLSARITAEEEHVTRAEAEDVAEEKVETDLKVKEDGQEGIEEKIEGPATKASLETRHQAEDATAGKHAIRIEKKSRRPAPRKIKSRSNKVFEEIAARDIEDEVVIEPKTKTEPLTADSEESVWRFGKQQIFLGLLGASLYAAINLFANSLSLTIELKSSILIFFSIAFGPWVGLITGVIGHLIYLIFST
jgi:Caspase domain